MTPFFEVLAIWVLPSNAVNIQTTRSLLRHDIIAHLALKEHPEGIDNRQYNSSRFARPPRPACEHKLCAFRSKVLKLHVWLAV